MKKKLLITGGAGFVGSNLAVFFKKKYPGCEVVSLDNLRRRGSELNLPRLKKYGVRFVRGDVRSPKDLERFKDVSLLIDAAAEPSVNAGMGEGPLEIIHHNLLGTVHCLELARKTGAGLIFLSSSRVYPIPALRDLGYVENRSRFVLRKKQKVSGVSLRGISEDFPLEGFRSPYGATKLCAELLIEEYRRFHKVLAVINRCGVITGPWQMGRVDQGFVALWVARHFWKKPLSYIGFGGEGKQVRDVLHVEDLFGLVDHEARNMDALSGQVFNVGGGQEVSVSLRELTALCRDVTGHVIPITSVAKTRQADIPIYLTDNSRVTQRTGWKPRRGVKKIVEDVHGWIRDNERSLESVLI